MAGLTHACDLILDAQLPMMNGHCSMLFDAFGMVHPCVCRRIQQGYFRDEQHQNHKYVAHKHTNMPEGAVSLD